MSRGFFSYALRRHGSSFCTTRSVPSADRDNSLLVMHACQGVFGRFRKVTGCVFCFHACGGTCDNVAICQHRALNGSLGNEKDRANVTINLAGSWNVSRSRFAK